MQPPGAMRKTSAAGGAGRGGGVKSFAIFNFQFSIWDKEAAKSG